MKLSCMCVMDVFDLQACDTHIMRVSWQVYVSIITKSSLNGSKQLCMQTLYCAHTKCKLMLMFFIFAYHLNSVV